MADVSITIRKNTAAADSTIVMSGTVDDSALAGYLNKVTQLLATSISATA